MKEYKYLSLKEIAKYEPEIRKAGVSKKARSPQGFLTYYKKIGGKPDKVNEFWRKNRHSFISRWLAIYKKRPTRNIKLILIVWAYMP